MPWLKKFIKTLLRRIHNFLFVIEKEYFPKYQISLRKNVKPKLFNLDAHISVIRDIQKGLSDLGVDVESWSISGSRMHLNKLITFPDPVKIINKDSWQSLDSHMAEMFADRYSSHLRRFDGFITCHPIAFMEIFDKFGKPILAINSTRYEMPYSGDYQKILALNKFIQEKHKSGLLTLLPNNLADLDYLSYYTGIEGNLQPSVCDYLPQVLTMKSGINLVAAKSQTLTREVQGLTNGKFVGLRETLGFNYPWSEVSRVNSIFLVPYNVSTMWLFELARLGIPVIVPSKTLMRSLRGSFDGVLSEISFYEMMKIDVSSFPDGDPNKYTSPLYLDWWLERADFYNSSLMPNVRVIESLEELNYVSNNLTTDKGENKLKDRNSKLYLSRQRNLAKFLEGL